MLLGGPQVFLSEAPSTPLLIARCRSNPGLEKINSNSPICRFCITWPYFRVGSGAWSGFYPEWLGRVWNSSSSFLLTARKPAHKFSLWQRLITLSQYFLFTISDTFYIYSTIYRYNSGLKLISLDDTDKKKTGGSGSVGDPSHFGADPDPRIRTID